MILYLDIETRSRCNLKTAGLHRYSETAEITLVQMAFDEGEVLVQEWGPVALGSVHWAIERADKIVIHGAEFDTTLLCRNRVRIPLDKAYCTRAQAQRHGLPGALDKLCEIFKLPVDQAKSKAGHRAMMLFCKPQRDGSWATRDTHPEQWAIYLEYARLDIEAMRALHRKMPTWNDAVEAAIWRLDQTINLRGFAVNTRFAAAAVELLSTNSRELAAEVLANTDGVVGSATQGDRLLSYLLAEHGVNLPDLTAATVARRLADEDLPGEVRLLLELRTQSSKTSTGKYKTLLNTVSSDGRLRGTLTYCGATRTGRWAGKHAQFHNLPRRAPDVPQGDIDAAIQATSMGCLDLVARHPTAKILSNCIRGVLVAPPGKTLLVADFANIEGRVIAWLSGEAWKLEAYRAYDEGTGPDTYKLAYSESFGVPIEDVTKAQRQIGKVQELMLAYEGGVGAFITGAETYGIDLSAMAASVRSRLPVSLWDQALVAHEWAVKKSRTYGLPVEVWCACDSIKRLWRAAHPSIVGFWADLLAAVLAAITSGAETRVGRLIVDRRGSWLRVRLPSGRYLCYPGARVEEGKVSYMGVNQYTRQWGRISTYAGKFAENVTQAVARDLLAAAMLNAEAAGLNPVLTIHDEVISEAEQGTPLDWLIGSLTDAPAWADGLPLAAAGFECSAYRKGD